MTYALSNPALTKGSLLIPLTPIKLSLLRDDIEDKFLRVGQSKPSDLNALDRTNETFELEAAKSTLLLLNNRVAGEIQELQCVIGEKTRSIYLREKTFDSLFCVYPSFLLNRSENLTADEEWLTNYFGVRGKVMRSHWRRKPQVVFEDYDKLKEGRFTKKRRLGKHGESTWKGVFATKYHTESLGETESVVVGHAIRIRPGTRNLVFEFYHPRTRKVGFWEFNERHTPKKSAKLFFDNWFSYYPRYGYYTDLFMKRLNKD